MIITRIERLKSSALFLTAVFSGGNIVSLILGMLGSILAARLIAPNLLGTFNGIGLTLGYIVFLQLGVLNGLNRELPYYIGRGETDEALALTSAAQSWAWLVGGIVSIVLLIIAVWFFVSGNNQLAAGWAAIAFSAFVYFFGTNYLEVTYRTHGDFTRLTIINIIKSGSGILFVPLVGLFGYYGLCLRSFFISLLNLIFVWRWRPLKVNTRFKKEKIVHLFKIGFPIFLVGQLYAWWPILDSTLVLKFLGTKGLGLYQLAIIVSTAMMLLPNSVSQIFYPRLAQEYGKTGNVVSLVAMLRRPVILLGLATIPLSVIGWFLIPPVAKILLPNYVEGVPAAQWMLLGVSVLMMLPLTLIFNVVKRQELFGTAIIFGIITYGLSLWLMSFQGLKQVNFPQAMLIGRAVFILFSIGFIYLLYHRKKKDY